MCNCDTKVTYTFDNTDHVIRNRKCKKCGYMFRTVETDEDIYHRLNKKEGNEKHEQP